MQVYVIRLKNKFDKQNYHLVRDAVKQTIEWRLDSGEVFKTFDEALQVLNEVQSTIKDGLAHIKIINIVEPIEMKLEVNDAPFKM